jgi:hypothetical protein
MCSMFLCGSKKNPYLKHYSNFATTWLKDAKNSNCYKDIAANAAKIKYILEQI